MNRTEFDSDVYELSRETYQLASDTEDPAIGHQLVEIADFLAALALGRVPAASEAGSDR